VYLKGVEEMRKYLYEGQARKEYHERKGVPRKPLRSLKELSEELGVTVMNLVWKLKKEGAPKPQLSKKKDGSNTQSWYEPEEFRAWWSTVKDIK
jgi:hypothetical protein